MKQRPFLVLAHRSLLPRNENCLSYKRLTHRYWWPSLRPCALGDFCHSVLFGQILISIFGLRESNLQFSWSCCWTAADNEESCSQQQHCHSVNTQKHDADAYVAAMCLGIHHLKFWQALSWANEWRSLTFAAETILRSRLGLSILVLAPIKTVLSTLQIFII